MLQDQYKRPLGDLRISVTDRCNFRCGYCMPGDRSYKFMPRTQLLSFEEIANLARLFTSLGVRKLRITGGEPLLRRDLPLLIAMLAGIEGIEDIALTTNGFYLAKFARDLKRAGLHRLTVSLDSLDPATFARLNGRETGPETVLHGIETAAAEGLGIKLNCVVHKGINDGELIPLATFARERGHVVRFIEFMDVGNINGWRLEHVMPARDMVAAIDQTYPCLPLDAQYPGEVARRFAYRDGGGEFGVIASVTQPFCGKCTRARLSSDGKLFTCLFAQTGHDLKAALRSPAGLQEVAEILTRIWGARNDRYSELRGLETEAARSKVEMFHIGG